MTPRFSETRLEREGDRLRLIGPSDEVILELRGTEIDDAVRAGFLDREHFHFSMFEYARIRSLAPALSALATGAPPRQATDSASFDRAFLRGLNISWD